MKNIWNRRMAGALALFALCGSMGCGGAPQENTRAGADAEESAAIEENPAMEGNTEEDAYMEGSAAIEAATEAAAVYTDMEETGAASAETPEEKTKRLRAEEPKAPSVSPDEVTELSIEIHKSEHSLQLWDGEELIAEYAAGLAKNPVGAKEKEGDNKNPEGSYYVCNKNSKSQYHLALGLSYPNAEDARRGYENGLISEAERDSLISACENGGKPDWYTALGGEIMIHGQKGEHGSESDWTRGCFAVDNEVMDLIWDYVEVGTTVTILK